MPKDTNPFHKSTTRLCDQDSVNMSAPIWVVCRTGAHAHTLRHRGIVISGGTFGIGCIFLADGNPPDSAQRIDPLREHPAMTPNE